MLTRGGNTHTTPSATPSAVPTEELANVVANVEANTTEVDQLYLLRYPWDNSPSKVGHAKDVTARVRSLEGGHNLKLQVLAIFLGQ